VTSELISCETLDPVAGPGPRADPAESLGYRRPDV